MIPTFSKRFSKFARPDILDKLTAGYIFGPRDDIAEVKFWVLSRAISEGQWLETKDSMLVGYSLGGTLIGVHKVS